MQTPQLDRVRPVLALAALSLALALPSSASALLLPAQGVAYDASGEPVDGPFTLVVSLYDAVDAVAPLWQEAHPDVQATSGLFSVLLGAHTPVDAVVATGADLWLGVQVDGGDELPRVQMGGTASAGHALAADNAQTVGGWPVAATPTAGHLLPLNDQGKLAAEAMPDPEDLAWPELYDGGEVDVRAFGAIPDDATDDTAAFTAALATGKIVRVPPGAWQINSATGLNLGATGRIRGAGASATTIQCHAMAAASGCLHATMATVSIADLTVSVFPSSGNHTGVQLTDCNDSLVQGVTVVGSGPGIWLRRSEEDEGAAPTGRECTAFCYWVEGACQPQDGKQLCFDRNRNNRVIGNRVLSPQGKGFMFYAASDTLIYGNYAFNAGTPGEGNEHDGFKFSFQSRRLRVIANHAVGNSRDGYDTFDGFQQSVLMGNVSQGNFLQGFEVKGKQSEAPGSPLPNWQTRESTVVGNIAIGNGTHGFLFQELRAMTVTGNTALSNAMSGMYLNNIQLSAFVGNHSRLNAQHGFTLQNVSRSSFSSNVAADNDFEAEDADPEDLAEDHYGFLLFDNTGSNSFSGDMTLNTPSSTTPIGTQKVGFWFEPTATNNILQGVIGRAQVGGTLGGEVDGQHVTAFSEESGFRGLRMQANGSAQIGGSLALAYPNGDGTEVSVGALNGTIGRLRAQDGLVAVGALSAHDVAFQTSGETRWSLKATGAFEPLIDNTYDLGTTANRVRHVYVSGNVDIGGRVVVDEAPQPVALIASQGLPDEPVDPQGISVHVVAVPGAAPGDPVTASLNNVLPPPLLLSAQVTGPDEVTVTIYNPSPGPLDIPGSTLRVLVWDLP